MKTIINILAITAGLLLTANSLLSQELFYSSNRPLYTMPPDHYYYAANQERNVDYITKSVENQLDYGLSQYSGTPGHYRSDPWAVTLTDNTGHITVPKSVIGSVVTSANRGLTISFWLKFEDVNQNISIGSFGSDFSDASKTKVDLAIIDKKIVVRKRNRLGTDVLSPIIKLDYPIVFGDFKAENNDLTNGFYYFNIASDDKTCRITYSRPGGRIFTRWYYVSLTDILTANDTFSFGRSPNAPNNTYSIAKGYDCVMVYKRYLLCDEILNSFYLQSPLYPGVSYQFKNLDGKVVAPENYNNDTQVFNADYYKWKDHVETNTGTMSCDKWTIKGVTVTGSTEPIIIFNNARSGGHPYLESSSSYYYQLLEPSSGYVGRVSFLQKHIIISANNTYSITPVDNAGKQTGQYQFRERNDNIYYLGGYNKYLYQENQLSTTTLWRHCEANKIYRGAEREINLADASEQYVRFKHQGSQKYMDIYWGGAYYYLVLKPKGDNVNQQKFTIALTSQTDFNMYKKYQIRNCALNSNISPYWGLTDKKEDEPIILNYAVCNWEFIYVKDDANNCPLYAIRANNEYGTFLLGTKSATCGNPCYVVQASAGVYTSSGSVKDDFLWSIEVLAQDN